MEKVIKDPDKDDTLLRRDGLDENNATPADEDIDLNLDDLFAVDEAREANYHALMKNHPPKPEETDLLSSSYEEESHYDSKGRPKRNPYWRPKGWVADPYGLCSEQPPNKALFFRLTAPEAKRADRKMAAEAGVPYFTWGDCDRIWKGDSVKGYEGDGEDVRGPGIQWQLLYKKEQFEATTIKTEGRDWFKNNESLI